jgi:hypothetical protein
MPNRARRAAAPMANRVFRALPALGIEPFPRPGWRTLGEQRPHGTAASPGEWRVVPTPLGHDRLIGLSRPGCPAGEAPTAASLPTDPSPLLDAPDERFREALRPRCGSRRTSASARPWSSSAPQERRDHHDLHARRGPRPVRRDQPASRARRPAGRLRPGSGPPNTGPRARDSRRRPAALPCGPRDNGSRRAARVPTGKPAMPRLHTSKTMNSAAQRAAAGFLPPIGIAN